MPAVRMGSGSLSIAARTTGKSNFSSVVTMPTLSSLEVVVGLAPWVAVSPSDVVVSVACAAVR